MENAAVVDRKAFTDGAAFVDGLIWVPGGGTDIGGSHGGTQHQVYRPAESCE